MERMLSKLRQKFGPEQRQKLPQVLRAKERIMTQPLTPAAERKRQQRARAAAGQVHRVAVYLTDDQLNLAKSHDLTGDDPAKGLLDALRQWENHYG